MDKITEDDSPIWHIAKVCYQANKAYCESIGDDSFEDWGDAEEWQRETVVNGVLLLKNNPHAGVEDMHNSWMKEKKDQGWVYGSIKDPDSKKHPCMVPYNDLPLFQRKKDYLFQAVALSLLKAGNLHVDFGDAIKAMKQGKRISREGWNGKGMYAFMQIPATIEADIIPKMQSVPDSVKRDMNIRVTEDSKMRYSNQAVLVKPNNEINGWSPSISDAFAEDWLILQ